MRDYLAALAARRPVALLLEDLHWADAASLDLLRVVTRDLRALPVLLLATYRDDELTRRHPLYALLPLLDREALAARLTPRRFDADDVGALVVERYALPEADAARLVAWLHGRAEGNAFFVAQLLRALEETGTLRQADGGWALGDLGAVGLPLPLRQVLDARLARLDEDSHRLLTLAAVVGQEVPLALWAAVAETDEDGLLDAIDAAGAARLVAVAPDGSGVRFAHALIREALYEGLVATRRRRVHWRVAEALAAAANPDPDTVADHLQRAGDPRAADWLIRAGERAQRAFAFPIARARYEAALTRLAEGAGHPARRGWLHLRLAMLQYLADQRRGLADLDEAAALADTAGDATLAACVAFQRGLLLFEAGERRRGLAALVAGDQALTALPPGAWPPATSALDGGAAAFVRPATDRRVSLAYRLAQVGRLAEAEALAGWSAAESGVIGAAMWSGAYLGSGFAHAALGRPEEAHRAFALAGSGDPQSGDPQRRQYSATLLALRWVQLPYRADRLAERRALVAAAATDWAMVSEIFPAALPNLARVPLLLVEGGWAEARALAAAGYAAGAGGFLLARSEFGALARAQGDTTLAWSLAREEFPLGPATPPGDADYLDALGLLRLAAALALDDGDLPLARAWLEAHDHWLAWSGATLGRSEGQALWARYHRQAGDTAQAHDRAEQALACATTPRQPLALLAAHRLLGELDTAAGDHTAARAHLGQALALADACAAPYERALTLLALADLRLATGDRPQATTTLAQARAILAPLAARPALARAEDLAARLAAPTAPGTGARAALPFGLTAREAEVLRLVAQGLGNLDIAARLSLSRRTVEQHLRSVYDKLGVENRAAATRLAVERGLA